MIIACDIDNIINNLAEKTIEIYNRNYKRNIKLSDIVSYNFYDCCSKEDADNIINIFKNKELWESLTPIDGSQHSLKQLIKKGHNIYLATATHPINFEWKVSWVKQYFPFIPEDNIIRIVDKGLLKADVIIDDCLDNLIGSFAERIVLDYPWNHSESKDYAYSIRRAYNWSDIVNIINDIEKEMKRWEKM